MESRFSYNKNSIIYHPIITMNKFTINNIISFFPISYFVLQKTSNKNNTVFEYSLMPFT